MKRVKENMREKIFDAIRADLLPPIKEIHKECLNNALDSIADADECIVFCHPPTARDIRTDGIFTFDP